MSAMIQRKVIRPNYRQKSQLGYSRIQLRTQGLNSADLELTRIKSLFTAYKKEIDLGEIVLSGSIP